MLLNTSFKTYITHQAYADWIAYIMQKQKTVQLPPLLWGHDNGVGLGGFISVTSTSYIRIFPPTHHFEPQTINVSVTSTLRTSNKAS